MHRLEFLHRNRYKRRKLIEGDSAGTEHDGAAFCVGVSSCIHHFFDKSPDIRLDANSVSIVYHPLVVDEGTVGACPSFGRSQSSCLSELPRVEPADAVNTVGSLVLTIEISRLELDPHATIESSDLCLVPYETVGM